MVYILFCFLIIFTNLSSQAEFEIFSENNINNSSRSVKIKLPFDSKAIIGSEKEGYVKDENQKILLKPLTKYQIKINAGGNYDLSIIKNGKSLHSFASLKTPFTLSALFGDSPIYFDGNWYHGQISIQRATTGIIAINILDLEQAIWSILSPFVRINDSVGAIKSAAIIMRSSLFALTLTSKEAYHLNSRNIGYLGLNGEKDYVINLAKQTEGEVLFSAHGELLYTPLRATALNGSLPFELIGQTTKAWERVVKIEEAAKLLSSLNYPVGTIISFEQKALSSPQDFLQVEGGPFLSVIGSSGSAQLSQYTTKKIFRLPSPYFRVYSFKGEDNQAYLQFIGSLPNNQASEPVLNIVRLIYESNNSFEDYKKVLKNVYPQAYLGKI